MVDISQLYERTSVPCCTITRDPPDVGKMENALRRYFPDWKERLSVIQKHPLHEIATSSKPIYMAAEGMELLEVQEIIEESTIRGVLPEPLRIAHLIATAMIKGESRGRA